MVPRSDPAGRVGQRCREPLTCSPESGTKLSMISDEGKGKRYVEEQAHGSAERFPQHPPVTV